MSDIDTVDTSQSVTKAAAAKEAADRMAHARSFRGTGSGSNAGTASTASTESPLTIRSAVLLTGLVMGHTLTYVTTEGADIPNGEAMASITPHTLGLILVRGTVKALVPWFRVVSCELA